MGKKNVGHPKSQTNPSPLQNLNLNFYLNLNSKNGQERSLSLSESLSQSRKRATRLNELCSGTTEPTLEVGQAVPDISGNDATKKFCRSFLKRQAQPDLQMLPGTGRLAPFRYDWFLVSLNAIAFNRQPKAHAFTLQCA